VHEEAEADHREEHEPERQLDDRRAVLEQFLARDAPAVEEEQRRQEQEEEDSGSSVTRRSAKSPITAPSAIWNSGSGSGSGTMRESAPLAITARTRMRTIVTVSNAAVALCSGSGDRP
jgi:hypothetical protein